jgi:hypothetical protein
MCCWHNHSLLALQINGQDDSEDEEEDAAEKGSEEAIADTVSAPSS